MTPFEKARTFIYRNARPVDLMRWRYHFESGSAEDVMHALSFYQNPDGGFGHALEADSFNPNSCPIQTWAATEIIREIHWTDPAHPVVQGILSYLDSGADFDETERQWRNSVLSNNDYPCAVWWKCDGTSEFRYNPTAALAGFALKFADPGSDVYRKCETIAREAYAWLCANIPFEETHITGCFLALYEYLTDAGTALIDMVQFRRILVPQANGNICRDPEKWRTDYVTLPSEYVASADSFLYADNAELLCEEARLIPEMLGEDGAFPVPWQWYNDHREFPLAENWWKAHLLIRRMLPYRKLFGGM
ncbi:MAG: hypothetical protein IJ037_02110 [Clostridia bacterium]|nr:hypothetical protein [Clostridia bacterium]